jgi:CubicO group peptidase (beta-lactamase class C family)
MPILFKGALFTVCLLFFSAPYLFAQKKADSIDLYIRNIMQRDSVPGGTLLITQHGKVLKQAVYGQSNVEHQVPARMETVYELASVSKPITATAIMMLAEAGKLHLDSSIALYLGNAVPENYRGATLRRLLSHTAGIPGDHYVHTKLYAPTPLRYGVKEQLSDLFKMKPEAPGEKFVYSNTGFFLLAAIIEKVTGGTYKQFIQTRIFDACGMKTASFINGDSIVPNRAQVYTKRKSRLVRFSLEAIQALDANGFGGLMCTVADYQKFLHALQNGQLIKPESLLQMQQPALLNNGQQAGPRNGSKIGLGWFLKPVEGVAAISHTGHTGTSVVYLPAQDLQVIFFSNLSAGYAMFGDKGYPIFDVSYKIAQLAAKYLVMWQTGPTSKKTVGQQ